MEAYNGESLIGTLPVVQIEETQPGIAELEPVNFSYEV